VGSYPSLRTPRKRGEAIHPPAPGLLVDCFAALGRKSPHDHRAVALWLDVRLWFALPSGEEQGDGVCPIDSMPPLAPTLQWRTFFVRHKGPRWESGRSVVCEDRIPTVITSSRRIGRRPVRTRQMTGRWLEPADRRSARSFIKLNNPINTALVLFQG
jgi:hypothetical protein